MFGNLKSITLLDELIREGRLLHERITRHYEVGASALAPEERISEAELEGWYIGVSRVIEQTFGENSDEVRVWEEGLERTRRQSWEGVGRVSPRGGNWVIYFLTESLGLLAQLRLLQLKGEPPNIAGLTDKPTSGLGPVGIQNSEGSQRRLLVFLCHGSEDKDVVRQIYRDLREDGADPWLDQRNILPGEDWDTAIRKAVRTAGAILVCLSSKSVNKEGYVQKEIKFALDIADEKPEGTIFVIPVKLEACDVPDRLSRLQSVNHFDEDGYEKILRALRARAESLELDVLPGDGSTEIFGRPLEDGSGRLLYKSRNLRDLLRRVKNGEIFADDVPALSTEVVVGISFEAMDEALAPFGTEARRSQEKDAILRFVGIRPPYHNWQQKNTKIHCYRNGSPEDGDTVREIEMIRVSSSNVAAIGYDPARELLRLDFLSGQVYEYYGVPRYLYEGLLTARSPGRFLDTEIKKRDFPYKQIQ